MRRLLLRHTVLRRLVTVPMLTLLLAVTAALTPVAVVLGGVLALRPGGRGRVARIAAFTLAYLAVDAAGLLAATWLWLRMRARTGRQRSLQTHYGLLTTLLRGLYAIGSPLFGLRVNPPMPVTSHDKPPDGTETQRLPPTPGRPLVVLSRHAGPGDSFLLVHALLTAAHRRPRIVLRQDLRFDPLLDVLLGRLPHCFVSPEPGGGAAATVTIKQLAETMESTDALLVFPEGGNFTARRRLRAIASLRRRGLIRESAQARRLHNVLPPQPAGVFTAIDAAPEAELVFVAHTGLDHMQTVRQAWQGIPLTQPVEVTWWTVPAEDVPGSQDARLRWLERNWAEIDAWISRRAEQRLTSRSPGNRC